MKKRAMELKSGDIIKLSGFEWLIQRGQTYRSRAGQEGEVALVIQRLGKEGSVLTWFSVLVDGMPHDLAYSEASSVECL